MHQWWADSSPSDRPGSCWGRVLFGIPLLPLCSFVDMWIWFLSHNLENATRKSHLFISPCCKEHVFETHSSEVTQIAVSLEFCLRLLSHLYFSGYRWWDSAWGLRCCIGWTALGLEWLKRLIWVLCTGTEQLCRVTPLQWSGSCKWRKLCASLLQTVSSRQWWWYRCRRWVWAKRSWTQRSQQNKEEWVYWDRPHCKQQTGEGAAHSWNVWFLHAHRIEYLTQELCLELSIGDPLPMNFLPADNRNVCS